MTQPLSSDKPRYLRCNVCEHGIVINGSDYDCSFRCRCTMRGCVPYLEKFDDIKPIPPGSM